jgi:hypothetical protein
MFTALTLSMALGAPVPPPATPVATGAAPRVMELKPNGEGKIVVTVLRTEMQKVPVAAGNAVLPNGGANVVQREVMITRQVTVELGEVKELTIATADGKKLEKEEAIKKLEKGGIVVVSADGNPVSPAFLKVFKDDTLVLSAKELAGPQGATGGFVRPGLKPLPVNPGGVQILPINPGNIQVVPAQGGANGVIQIQVQPGNVQVLPAPVPAPAEKVPAKPEEK